MTHSRKLNLRGWLALFALAACVVPLAIALGWVASWVGTL